METFVLTNCIALTGMDDKTGDVAYKVQVLWEVLRINSNVKHMKIYALDWSLPDFLSTFQLITEIIS